MLTAGTTPRVRVGGRLGAMAGETGLTGEAIEGILVEMLGSDAMASLQSRDIDFAFSWRQVARVRGNAFMQRGEPAVALRLIPSRIPSFEELGLPPAIAWAAELPQGLVLLTGPSGSGKSTTLASVIDHINSHRELHILTVEDPIEFVHDHKLSVVNQREIGLDCDSFQGALYSALREDPDVLLVGEMRDLESIQIALTMAETGHLVFATLHTNDTGQALDRIVDVFPSERQEHIRTQLAACLNAVIAQRLLPSNPEGMVAAFEILVATPAVRNVLREGKTNQLRNIITTGSKDGMVTLEASMARLVRAGLVTYEAAAAATMHPSELTRALEPMLSPTPR
jgi:twitching motility protein PilT